MAAQIERLIYLNRHTLDACFSGERGVRTQAERGFKRHEPLVAGRFDMDQSTR